MTVPLPLPPLSSLPFPLPAALDPRRSRPLMLSTPDARVSVLVIAAQVSFGSLRWSINIADPSPMCLVYACRPLIALMRGALHPVLSTHCVGHCFWAVVEPSLTREGEPINFSVLNDIFSGCVSATWLADEIASTSFGVLERSFQYNFLIIQKIIVWIFNTPKIRLQGIFYRPV